jgi:hypothetical protein
MDACDTPDCSQTLKELDVFLDSELSDAARDTIRHHLLSRIEKCFDTDFDGDGVIG